MKRIAIVMLAALFVMGLVFSAEQAEAAATAEGVALYSGADCDDASLDITLTTVGATREYGLSTLLDGTILDEFEQGTGIGDFSGTFEGYGISAGAPDGSIIGSYAYVGETPPSAADTAEFFVLYQCGTNQQVIYSCYGDYGTCPQTAQEAWQQINTVPTMGQWGMIIFVLVAGAASVIFIRRHVTA
jgi:hypothetical protein